MKLAAILTVPGGGTNPPVPAERYPTVLSLGSVGGTIPAMEAVRGALAPLTPTVMGYGQGDAATPDITYVRVEDSVIIGDLLDLSGDVYHKHIQ